MKKQMSEVNQPGRRGCAAGHACPPFVADARPVTTSAAPVAAARRSKHIALLDTLAGIYVFVTRLAADAGEAVGAPPPVRRSLRGRCCGGGAEGRGGRGRRAGGPGGRGRGAGGRGRWPRRRA